MILESEGPAGQGGAPSEVPAPCGVTDAIIAALTGATISAPPQTNGDLLREALAAITRGWVLVPIVPGTKRPRGDEWQLRRSTSETEVRAWVANGLNIGLVCGEASGVFVLDFDTPKFDVELAAATTDEQRSVIEAERGRHLALRDSLPNTPCVLTGGGGRHYYFRWRPGLGCSRGALPRHVDAKGEGGQVLLPGSVHPTTGRPYAWEAAP